MGLKPTIGLSFLLKPMSSQRFRLKMVRLSVLSTNMLVWQLPANVDPLVSEFQGSVAVHIEVADSLSYQKVESLLL